ncbi:hypothetical protein A9Q84_05535 [Halobacteriovorax marinus]|uniref:Insecticide toxin TcdB middle/N-terminal domain-containing protein n=1 Tax=Halobacteriovorax marinus TaxID=97084 RepID=A0A1Y5FHS3_9BACT|nr:hypothetical protein A9Q84_05535 [Halobacteriovorax marinus]
MKMLTNLFLILCTLLTVASIAGERHEGREPREHRDDPETQPDKPSFSAPGVSAALQLSSPVSTDAATEALEKRLVFDPVLAVNTNRGDFKTSFSIGLPKSFSSLSNFSFSYNSQSGKNLNFGIGWNISLPMISKNPALDSITPYTEVNGGGELTKVDSKHHSLVAKAFRFADLVEIQYDSHEIYKQVVESSFSVYVALKKQGTVSGWVTFDSSGQRWIFNKNGQPIGLFNRYFKGVRLTWSSGKLVKISESNKKWHAQFHYKNTNSTMPVFLNGTFQTKSSLLNEISISQGETTHHYFFKYSGKYLSQVVQKDALLPLFQAEYKKLSFETSEENNTLENEDEKSLIYSKNLNQFQIVEKGDQEDIFYQYVDLNNDGRKDRITIDYTAINKRIKNELEGISYNVPKKCGKVTPTISAGTLSSRINNLSPEIKVEIAVWSGGDNIAQWEEDKSLTLSGKNIKLLTYDVSTKVHVGEKECFKTDYYHVSAHSNGLFFVDINADGKKDVVVCQGEKSLSRNTHEKQSNLNLSILKRLGYSEAQDISFDDVFSKTGSKAQVYIQNFNEKKAFQIWLDNEGEEQIETTKNHLLGLSGWKKASQVNFNCHQYTLFNDYNRDGYVDVLSGKNITFLGEDGNYQNLTLDDNSLKALFEKGDKSFDLKKGDIIFADIDGNGTLEPHQARSFTVHPLKGTKVLVRDGINEIYPNTPDHKVLTYLQSPYEGFASIDYAMKDGVVVTKTIDKVFKFDQPAHHRKFNYLSPMKDIYRGTFIGFSRTEETDYVDHENSEGRLIERSFSKDLSSKALLFKSRGRLNGKALLVKIWNKDKIKSYQSSFKTYKYINLDKNRIYPFLQRDLSVRYLKDNRSYGWSLEVISTPEINLEEGIINLVTEKRGHGLKSPYTDQLLEAVQYKSKRMEIDSDTNVLKVLKTASSDKDHKVIRYGSTFEYENSNLVAECTHKRCKEYVYDELGRTAFVNSSLGDHIEISYKDNSPLVSRISQDGETTSVQYLDVTNEVLSKKNSRGVKHIFDYTVSGIKTHIRRVDSESGEVELWKAVLPRIKECEGKEKFSCVENSYSIYFPESEKHITVDGFGRITSTSHSAQFKTLFPGKVILDAQGKVLERYRAQLGGESTILQIENKYDAIGRIIHERDSLVDRSIFHEYVNGCHKLFLEGAMVSHECKSSLNNILDIGHKGESYPLDTNSLGGIDSLNKLGLKWKTNFYGEITAFTTVKDLNGSPLINSQILKISEQGHIVENQDGFIWETDALGRMVRTSKGHNLKRTDVFEEMAYEKGKLKAYRSKLKDGSLIEQLEIKYNDLGLAENVSSLFFEQENKYDFLGRVISTKKELKNGDSSQVKLIYKNGSLLEIKNIVKVEKRTVGGQISKLIYPNGLILRKRFKNDLVAVTSQKVSSRNGKLWQELIDYNTNDFVSSLSTSSSLRSQNTSSSYDYSDEGKLRIGFQGTSVRRDLRGRATRVNGLKLRWNSQNLSRVTKNNGDDFEIYYDNNDQLLAYCPKGINLSKKSDQCTIRISEDHFLAKGVSVELIRFENLKVAVRIDGKTYPIVTNYLGSVVAMFSSLDEDNSQLLWERSFDTWGNKKVFLNDDMDHELTKKLESLTLWSYAHLLSFSDISKDLYWSKSRVYSAMSREWLSVDPMVKWSPNGLILKPGNWHSVRYCDNDPVNLVDPSGFSSIDPSAFFGGGSSFDFDLDFGFDSQISEQFGSEVDFAVEVLEMAADATMVAAGGVAAIGVGVLLVEAAPVLIIAGTMEINMAFMSIGGYVAKNPVVAENIVGGAVSFVGSFVAGVTDSKTPLADGNYSPGNSLINAGTSWLGGQIGNRIRENYVEKY